MRAHPAVKGVVAIVPPGNQAFIFTNLKPRDQRTQSVDQVMADFAPRSPRYQD
ncbi:MAG: hypothetical protein WKF37_18795 [Bryobacteraceae bacterium]